MGKAERQIRYTEGGKPITTNERGKTMEAKAIETKEIETKATKTKIEAKAPVKPWIKMTAKPIIAKMGRTNDAVVVPSPWVMTAKEKTAYKVAYPSRALGVRAFLMTRPSTFQEAVAFRMAVYGGNQRENESGLRGLFGDTGARATKMGARYKLTCANGKYSVSV